MCDEWMPTIELALSLDEFHQLPRNAAYKYEYLEGRAYLSPRPKHFHALLNLKSFQGSAEAMPVGSLSLRQARAEDMADLIPLFTGALRRTQPFGSLDDATCAEAARKSLERVWAGGDGPWIESASFLAHAAERQGPIGAILITLLPQGDPCEWDSYYWNGPPPAHAVAERLGRPHLTWIFVGPLHAGRGVGTTLLHAAARQLLALGYQELASTFMIGNDSSMLWHWRSGFRLLAYPGSRREQQKRWRQ